MKPYLLIMMVSFIYVATHAQEPDRKKQLAAVQQERSRLVKQQDTLRNKAVHDSELLDSLQQEFLNTKYARNGYSGKLSDAGKRKADSLGQVMDRQSHLKDSIQEAFDRHLVLLDSITGRVNVITEKESRLQETKD